VSNHEDLRSVAKRFDIPFTAFRLPKKTKRKAKNNQIEILRKYEIDFIVLARYMQIITPDLIALYENKIINIHHSFLPAFPVLNPIIRHLKEG